MIRIHQILKMYKFCLAILTWIVIGCGCGGGGGGGGASSVTASPDPLPPPLGTGPATCINGDADGFSCSGISLRKRVSLETMGGTAGNDIWGWFDAQSGKEYALAGMSNGTAFVDVSSPEEPVFLGRSINNT